MRYIHAKVTAGARKETFQEVKPDHFEISVREHAERNHANTRVIALLARHFKVQISKVRIINGHHHPSKLLVIEN